MSKEDFGNHTIKSPYVGHLYYGDDNKDVDLKYIQAMHHILCCNSLILVSNPKTQSRTCLILYNIITNNYIEKNVFLDHCVILKVFEKEVNGHLRT
jgi:hypothetical protein